MTRHHIVDLSNYTRETETADAIRELVLTIFNRQNDDENAIEIYRLKYRLETRLQKRIYNSHMY